MPRLALPSCGSLLAKGRVELRHPRFLELLVPYLVRCVKRDQVAGIALDRTMHHASSSRLARTRPPTLNVDPRSGLVNGPAFTLIRRSRRDEQCQERAPIVGLRESGSDRFRCGGRRDGVGGKGSPTTRDDHEPGQGACDHRRDTPAVSGQAIEAE